MSAGGRGVQHVEGAHCQLVSMDVLRVSVALSACRPSLHRVNGGIDVFSEVPKMLQVAEDIYEDVTRRKASHEQCPLPAPASKKAKGGLRVRDPW